MFYYLISPLSDASQSNACACNICDCCKHSNHLIADTDAYGASDAAVAAAGATTNANYFDANDPKICAVDIDSGHAFNIPSPIIRRRHKKVDECCCSTTSTTAMTTKQTRSKLAQHRKSLSENDLLNEIDNALVFSKGFLYAYGKLCVCVAVRVLRYQHIACKIL